MVVNHTSLISWFLAAVTLCSTTTVAQDITWHASGTQGVVAAGHADSVTAGVEVLNEGGRAADAAATTILALAVTDYGWFSMGGEVPVLVYDAATKQVQSLS